PTENCAGEEKTIAKYKKGIGDNDLTQFGNLKAQSEKTIGIAKSGLHSLPVTGWLVCIDGNEKGRDYRLHAGRNFVGRSMTSDVAICDDVQISRENHCSVVFEPNEQTFSICSGNGITYVNDELLQEPMQAKDETVLTLGNTKLVLIAFCVEGRTWGKNL
ncbi:MAG: FHA domain-containing protein, partial [Oscillospiraceae bacterium]